MEPTARSRGPSESKNGPADGADRAVLARVATGDLAALEEPTSGAQVYRAWVIVPGSAPLPTGWFRVGDAGVGSIRAATAPIRPGAVVAIAPEPAPGATTPTLTLLASGTTATPAN